MTSAEKAESLEFGDSGRRVRLEGAFNFRDLGGYPARDGRSTRHGVLFRSDALHRLTPADLAVLQPYGLRTVLDLRTADEVGRSGRGPLKGCVPGYLHLSILDREGGESAGIPAPAGDDLAQRYLWYLEVGRSALVDALCTLADPNRHPLVFHCSAGKDRTGVLSALVLELLEVERAAIVADYALTAGPMARLLERMRQDPLDAARLAEAPASRLMVHPATMARFLELLMDRHGGALAWALDAGLDEEHVHRLRESLLAVERGD